MNESIKKRIEAVRRGEVPEGYITENHQLRPAEWRYEKIGKYLVPYDEFSNDTETYPLATSSRQGLMLQSEYYSDQRYEETSGGFHVVPEGYVTYRHMSDDDIFRFNVNRMGSPVLVSPEYPVFTTSDDLHQDMLIAYLNNRKEFTAYCSAQKKGSTRTRMYFSRLGEFTMPIPPIAEQQKIAEILATCDRVIELKQQLLEEKRRQKQWLMQKLLDPNSATVVEKRLGDVCTINDCGIDGLSGDNEVFYIDIAAVDNGEIVLPASPIKLQDAPVRARRTFKRGDILMSTVRPYLHAFAYVDFDADNYVASTGFSILRAKNGVSSRLIYQLLFTAEMDKQYGSVLVGSNYPALNTSDVESLVVFIPENYEKQEAVANTLAVADQQIRLLNSEIEAWQQKKKALMQILLTGLVRVNA